VLDDLHNSLKQAFVQLIVFILPVWKLTNVPVNVIFHHLQQRDMLCVEHSCALHSLEAGEQQGITQVLERLLGVFVLKKIDVEKLSQDKVL
jgi:hypothetical protein